LSRKFGVPINSGRDLLEVVAQAPSKKLSKLFPGSEEALRRFAGFRKDLQKLETQLQHAPQELEKAKNISKQFKPAEKIKASENFAEATSGHPFEDAPQSFHEGIDKYLKTAARQKQLERVEQRLAECKDVVSDVAKQESKIAPQIRREAQQPVVDKAFEKPGEVEKIRPAEQTKCHEISCPLEHKAAFPKNESQLKHILCEREGHLIDTLANRKLVLDTISQENFLLVDQWGKPWYHQILEDGSQVWVTTKNGIIQNCGRNQIPRKPDPTTGLARNLDS